MTPTRWQEIERLYHAALERLPITRDEFLTEACKNDSALRREVESLLAQDSSKTDKLDQPPWVGLGGLTALDATVTVMNPGTQLGPYRIEGPLGKGGMGEVFRAVDTRLGRPVAVKVCANQFGGRFEREARAISTLNHPHICTLYDVGPNYLIMELVEGETLAATLNKGPLPMELILRYGVQIADALAAAHAQGITHRDLKPANIMVTKSGIKVLDFGLAKITRPDDAPKRSETLTASHAVMGTLAYMAPEQLEGKGCDARTDIFSLGLVLYEMVMGKKAFTGDSQAALIAEVIRCEPAPMESVPEKFIHVVERSLARDPDERWQTAKDLKAELLWAAKGEAAAQGVSAEERPRRTRAWWVSGRALLIWIALGVLVVVGSIVTAWMMGRATALPEHNVSRFMLSIPTDVQLSPEGGFGSSVSVSPDGAHLIFAARRGGTVQLYSRTIQIAETKALPETERARLPFFSPDSQWLAFFAGGKLKKVPINGGVPVVVCDVPDSRGGFWGANGTIVFSPQARGVGIFQVSADGGVAKQVTTLDTGRGETSHRFPELLPGDETVLFAAYGATYQDVSVVAQSLKTGERLVLIHGASMPHYANGRLFFVQPKLPGTVMAVAFDPVTLKLNGTPVAAVEGVLTVRGDYAHWTVSDSGMLVYAPGGFQEAASNLVFVDRKGGVAPVGAPPERPYHFPRLSPDGRRLVVSLQGIQNTLWTYDLSGDAFNRLTFEGNNDWAAWTPDGKRVTYASNRAEPWRLFWKPFDGSGKEELLLARDKGDQQPYSWSPDGKVLVYQDTSPVTGQDIWMLPIDGDRRPRPLLQTPASEADARLSPDGRWLAYASDESGRREVYVVPFPGPGGKWQISSDGGREPVWGHNGRELFYRNGDKMMMAEVTPEATFQAATPRLLFQGPYQTTATISPEYDVTPDGQRFLMIQPSEQRSPATEFNVVLNWFEELKQRMPVR